MPIKTRFPTLKHFNLPLFILSLHRNISICNKVLEWWSWLETIPHHKMIWRQYKNRVIPNKDFVLLGEKTINKVQIQRTTISPCLVEGKKKKKKTSGNNIMAMQMWVIPRQETSNFGERKLDMINSKFEGPPKLWS